MTDASQPSDQRRRFRFSLRMLLAVVTLAAVASWGYWIGWPWWERQRFEYLLRQLKAGATFETTKNDLGEKPYLHIKITQGRDGKSYVGISRYIVGNAVYCVFYRFPIRQKTVLSASR